MFDGVVALVACDKTIPGAAMALLRLNIPGVIMYGGTIMPGHYKGRDLTVLDVFEAVGANAAGNGTVIPSWEKKKNWSVLSECEMESSGTIF